MLTKTRAPRLALVRLEDRCTPANFTVNSLRDVIAGSGDEFSLRMAILAANNLNEPSTIVFKKDGVSMLGTIDLDSELPHQQKDITIDGVRTITVERSPYGPTPQFRIFTVDTGSTSKLLGLTIQKGDIDGDGGGVANFGTLTIEKSSVAVNQATGNGGGIYNAENHSLTLKETSVGENQAFNGGGVYSAAGGTVTIIDSTVGVNQATSLGGGLCLSLSTTGSATITNTSVYGNWTTTPTGKGGGVYVDGNAGRTLSITGGELRQNSSAYGGGLWTSVGTTISGVSITGNSASRYGGGVYATGVANLTLDPTTSFNNNTAPANAGDGIYWIRGNGGTLTNNANMGNNSVVQA